MIPTKDGPLRFSTAKNRVYIYAEIGKVTLTPDEARALATELKQRADDAERYWADMDAA